MGNLHPLEVVGRYANTKHLCNILYNVGPADVVQMLYKCFVIAGETQLQVGENLNYLFQRFKCFPRTLLL